MRFLLLLLVAPLSVWCYTLCAGTSADTSDCLMGWATQYRDSTGALLPVTGGEGAPSTNIYHVYNRSALLKALANANSPTYLTNTTAALLEKKIIYVHGTIHGDQLTNGSFATEAYYRTYPNKVEFYYDLYLLSVNSTYMALMKAAAGNSTTSSAYQYYYQLSRQNGWRATYANNQKAQIQFTIPSHTSLIGVGSTAQLLASTVIINAQTNIVIRNLYIEAPRDLAPSFDFDDLWNARYDGISIVTGTRIWIDHCKLDDGRYPISSEPIRYGSHIERHDGLLDMEDGADFITVSHCIFANHHKTSMLGSGDSHADKDAGHLRITFYGNLYSNSQSRNPMVRFGKVHSVANYMLGTLNTSNDYTMKGGYFLGLQIESKVFSESNVFEVTPTASASSSIIIGASKCWQFKDVGSCFNGANVSAAMISAASSAYASSKASEIKSAASSGANVSDWALHNFTTNLNWTVPYAYASPGTCAQVKASVLANAGVGKISDETAYSSSEAATVVVSSTPAVVVQSSDTPAVTVESSSTPTAIVESSEQGTATASSNTADLSSAVVVDSVGNGYFIVPSFLFAILLLMAL